MEMERARLPEAGGSGDGEGISASIGFLLGFMKMFRDQW